MSAPQEYKKQQCRLYRYPLHFMLGAGNGYQFPDDTGAEIAFVGRSNAGKSSAINTLTGQRSLARTSKQPGRTQQVNFFRINDSDQRIVDLPGYGYAKVPERLRQAWRPLMEAYFLKRQSLRGLIIIIDIRRGIASGDELILDWCCQAQLPGHILLTKSDKLSKAAASAALHGTRKMLVDSPAITVQTFSSLKRTGLDEAYQTIESWFATATESNAASDA